MASILIIRSYGVLRSSMTDWLNELIEPRKPNAGPFFIFQKTK